MWKMFLNIPAPSKLLDEMILIMIVINCVASAEVISSARLWLYSAVPTSFMFHASVQQVFPS